MKNLINLIIILFLCIACNDGGGAGDPPPESAAGIPAKMYDKTTPLGFKIQSNGYKVDLNYIDSAFLKTESCAGFKNTPTDLFIILKEPNKAFPCSPLPETGCGGLYDPPVLTVTADLYRYKHEIVHHVLYNNTENLDPVHQSPLFDKCS